MHKFVSFNGKIIESEQALVPAASSAIFYGRSVFTTIAIRDGKPLFWEKHWVRLTRNAAKRGIDFSNFSQDGVGSSLSQLLEVNTVSDGRARITLFDEAGKWLITTSDLRGLPERFRIAVSPHPINSRS